jgi:hypothetical protein
VSRRVQGEPEKVDFGALPARAPLGVPYRFEKGELKVPPHKLKIIRKELGKVLVAQKMTCRKISSIFGQVRSSLMALPFLRVVTDQLMVFSNFNLEKGWDHQIFIPQALKDQIKELKTLLDPELGRPFREKPTRILFSDSSDLAWGGIDQTSGSMVQNFWREKKSWHINLKELEAASSTIMSLASPGDSVLLHVDNTVTLSYLRKQGGKKLHLNALLKPLLLWCLKHKVQFQVNWVPSEK